MNEKAQLNAMAEKYKAEMMRLYNKSAPAKNTPKPTMPPKQTPPEHTPKMTIPEPEKALTPEPPKMPEQQEQPQKFPSPKDIIQAEDNGENAVHTIAAAPMRAENAAGIPHPHGGNYGFSDDPSRTDEIPYPYGQNTSPQSENAKGLYPFEQIPSAQPDSTLEPLYTDNAPDLTTSSGYLQAEISTANRAFPIKDASVIVTRKNGDKSELIALLTTDENGLTETIELPAPNIAYSESPEQTQKPFTDYQLAVYARGFYTIPLLNVPIFPTVKSIQPVSMIPLVQFAPGGSTLPQ